MQPRVWRGPRSVNEVARPCHAQVMTKIKSLALKIISKTILSCDAYGKNTIVTTVQGYLPCSDRRPPQEETSTACSTLLKLFLFVHTSRTSWVRNKRKRGKKWKKKEDRYKKKAIKSWVEKKKKAEWIFRVQKLTRTCGNTRTARPSGATELSWTESELKLPKREGCGGSSGGWRRQRRQQQRGGIEGEDRVVSLASIYW